MAQIEKEEEGNKDCDDDDNTSLTANLTSRIKKFQDKIELNNAIASILLSSLFILETYDIDSRKYPAFHFF